MIRELGRFSVVGVVNVLMYYAIYLILHLLLPYLVAHVAAYVVTIGTSFLLNCYFTYRTPPTLRKFLLFPLTQVAGLITTSVGVTVLVEWAGLGERISPIVATGLAVPVSFLLSRRILKGRTSWTMKIDSRRRAPALFTWTHPEGGEEGSDPAPAYRRKTSAMSPVGSTRR